MKPVAMVLVVELIPIAVLIGGVLKSPLSRRSRFGLRVGGALVVTLLPALVAAFGQFGEQTGGPLLLLGFPWGLMLAGVSRFLLFYPAGPDHGSDDDGDDGPGPGEARPTPPVPWGGLPIPDAHPPRYEYATIRSRAAHREPARGHGGASVVRHGSGPSG